jgi:hypothetical protein
LPAQARKPKVVFNSLSLEIESLESRWAAFEEFLQVPIQAAKVDYWSYPGKIMENLK